MTGTTPKKRRSAVGKWTRRGFLASAGLIGGGLALGLTLAPNRLKMHDPEGASDDETVLNTWVKITPDNRITVLIPHSEMGQGAGTGLAQMLAEEMEADWDRVGIVQAPVTDAYVNSDLGRGYIVGEGANIPGFIYPLLDFSFLQIANGLVGQLTGGSTAIRLTGQHGMRRAGASAKEMLLKAAAEAWDVPVGTLVAEKSHIIHRPTGQSTPFGALATRAAAFSPSLKPALKEPRDYTIVGRSKPRLDLPAKVDGSAQFGMDAIVPDMVYAAIQLPPIRDARAVALDDGGMTRRSGLGPVVNIEDAVAVTADSYWTASMALQELDISWAGGRQSLTSEGIRKINENDLATKEREDMDTAGDVDAALQAGTRIAADYAVPYLAHATMEPLNCTAWVRDGRCDLWVGHQNQLFARNHAAEILGIAPDQVTVHPQYLGGGFGRRARMDFIALSVRIAREVGRPVKVIWSREADMANGVYRPAIISRMEGAVENGRITGLRHAYIDADSGMPDSERPFAFQYDVPSRAIARVKCPSPIPVGPWRSVDFTQIGFFNETFMDELALAANADPLEFRLRHTSDPRIRMVLERLGREADWGADRGPRRAQGLAMVKSFETIVAQAVDASVDDDGGVRVHKVTSVVDCGRLINPDAGEAQIKGSVIFGLTSALYGEITVDGGVIQQLNFPDYEMMRLHNAPVQDVHFIDSDGELGGLGEPGVPPVTPALANAIFFATDTRIRELPIAKHGLFAA